MFLSKEADKQGNADRRYELKEDGYRLARRDTIDELTPLSPIRREHDLSQVHIISNMVEADEVEFVGR